MDFERLKMLSVMQLAEELKISNEKAQDLSRKLRNKNPTLYNILRHYETLSDDSLTHSQMAGRIGKSEPTIASYRSYLLDFGLTKPLSKGNRLWKIKKLCKPHNTGGKYLMINSQEMKMAGLDPEKEYPIIIEPLRSQFRIVVFKSEKAAQEYQARKLKS